ncbi:MAG: hypothetical protein NDI61_09845 [Bdellovibrionaceae bacterium]|nr:hypothetical protein [Pseudobdellovibrionaceae bacterium]
MKIFDESAPWQRHLSAKTLERWPDDIVLVPIEQLSNYSGPVEKCIVVADKLEPKDEVQLLTQGKFRHVVQLTNPKFEQTVNFAAHAIANPVEFMTDIVSNIFANRPAAGELKIQKFPFRHSKEKTNILANIRQYIEGVEKSRHVVDPIITMADEMFTNAIFNAPTDAQGKKKFAKLQRNSSVELDPEATAEIIIAHHENILLIGCEDSYGSLLTSPLLERLNECYSVGVAAALNTGTAGSGIGCYLILEQSTSFMVAVQPGGKTFVAGMVLLGLPSRLLVSIPKNIHFVIAEP